MVDAMIGRLKKFGIKLSTYYMFKLKSTSKLREAFIKKSVADLTETLLMDAKTGNVNFHVFAS